MSLVTPAALGAPQRGVGFPRGSREGRGANRRSWARMHARVCAGAEADRSSPRSSLRAPAAARAAAALFAGGSAPCRIVAGYNQVPVVVKPMTKLFILQNVSKIPSRGRRTRRRRPSFKLARKQQRNRSFPAGAYFCVTPRGLPARWGCRISSACAYMPVVRPRGGCEGYGFARACCTPPPHGTRLVSPNSRPFRFIGTASRGAAHSPRRSGGSQQSPAAPPPPRRRPPPAPAPPSAARAVAAQRGAPDVTARAACCLGRRCRVLRSVNMTSGVLCGEMEALQQVCS